MSAPEASRRWRRYADAMDAVTGGTCPDDLICAVMSVADDELEEARSSTSVGASAPPANETPTCVGTAAPDQSAAVYELIAHLKAVPVQCTALTGPVWYGSGWKDAIGEAEEFAMRREGHGTPATDPLATTELAILLHGADDWWHRGSLPAWEDLPQKIRTMYWGLAYHLTQELFVSRRTKTEEED